jgi:hypothetical protein
VAEKTDRTSRLAIPSNDPLAWLQTFDYAQPGTAAPVERMRLQTFGSGPDQEILPGLNGQATLEFERLRVTHPARLHLVNQPWAAPYARALVTDTATIDVADFEADVWTALPVLRYDIRFVGDQVFINAEGHRIPVVKIRELESGSREWSAVIERAPQDRTQPLEIDGGRGRSLHRRHRLHAGHDGRLHSRKSDRVRPRHLHALRRRLQYSKVRRSRENDSLGAGAAEVRGHASGSTATLLALCYFRR